MVRPQELTGQKTKMKIKREDWEKVIQESKKQYDLILNTLKGMIIAAECQKVTFDLAVEKLKEISRIPEKKKI